DVGISAILFVAFPIRGNRLNLGPRHSKCRPAALAGSTRGDTCAGCRTSSTSKVWGYGHGCRSSAPSWGDPRAAAACGLAPWPTATASGVSLAPASRRLLVSSLLQFDVDPLAVGHAGAVGVAGHEPAG